MRMKRSKLLRTALVTIVLAGAVSAAWVERFRPVEVRYRVTVVIDEGGVERRGSAVWSSELWRPILPLASTYSGNIRADAIPIKLGNGAYLFVLLADYDPSEPGTYQSPGNGAAGIAGNLFDGHVTYRGYDKIELYKAIAKERPKGRLVCPKTGYRRWAPPDGSKVPTTIDCFQLAYSARPAVIKDLQRFDAQCAYFSASCPIRIKRAYVEVTDDPVTRPLNAVLPWMRGDYDFTGTIDGLKAQRLGVSDVIFSMRS